MHRHVKERVCIFSIVFLGGSVAGAHSIVIVDTRTGGLIIRGVPIGSRGGVAKWSMLIRGDRVLAGIR